MSSTHPALPEPVTRHAAPLRGPVLMDQRWRDATFLHWRVEPDELMSRVGHRFPRGVRPDAHEADPAVTWVGLVLFRMVGAGPARDHPVPWLGTFLETNVRLYSVDERGRRGVVFLSLDTDRLGVVLGARAAFGVPYRWARMEHQQQPSQLGAGPLGQTHRYEATLRWPGSTGHSRVAVRVGHHRDPSPLDDFLTARWRLHTSVLGQSLQVPNEHEPWPLHDLAELDVADHPREGLVASVGLPGVTERPPDHTAWSPGVRTRFGLPGR